jgi:mannosylglycerate hydrolase
MKTIYLISHTHWDREWYLPFQQFRLKLIHLIDHLLEILEDDLEFKYFLLDGQTILLEDYLQIRPEKELELRKHIAAGRILIGPWYISPDEFLVAPESHIRNLLVGDKLCQKYGGKMMVGYLPDSFGHIGQMPQILNGFGIYTACLWRGLDDQLTDLIWKAPDGSGVLLAYLRDSYSNAANLTTSDPEKFAKEVNELILSISPYSISGNILLMLGTDHMEPPADITCALRTSQINTQTN